MMEYNDEIIELLGREYIRGVEDGQKDGYKDGYDDGYEVGFEKGQDNALRYGNT